jgi:hypothetical protein
MQAGSANKTKCQNVVLLRNCDLFSINSFDSSPLSNVVQSELGTCTCTHKMEEDIKIDICRVILCHLKCDCYAAMQQSNLKY